MSKHTNDVLNQPNNDVPVLDIQTAGQLLNNVFDACDKEPNSVPIDVLESWGNFKKPPFEPLKKVSFVIILLLILLPLMFFKPAIIAERTNVDDLSSAVYSIDIKTLLPTSSVTASLDGAPIALTADGGKKYTAKLDKNGTLEIVAVAFNGQVVKRDYEVVHVDTEKPEFLDSYSKNGYVYILLRDTYSGIDYENITGLTPAEYDEKTGLVKVKIPDTPTAINIPDKAGNTESLLLSPVN